MSANDYERDDKFANRDLPGENKGPRPVSLADKLFLVHAYVSGCSSMAKEIQDDIRHLRERAKLIEKNCARAGEMIAEMKMSELDRELDDEAKAL
jgi:hypothetical protein